MTRANRIHIRITRHGVTQNIGQFQAIADMQVEGACWFIGILGAQGYAVQSDAGEGLVDCFATFGELICCPAKVVGEVLGHVGGVPNVVVDLDAGTAKVFGIDIRTPDTCVKTGLVIASVAICSPSP